MTIGQRIKARRKELGMTADELGEKLGKNRSTIYRYENGDIEKMPLDYLEPIAKALLTTPEYLMNWNAASAEEAKKSDANADITDRLLRDDNFRMVVEMLNKLDKSQLDDARLLLKLSFKDTFNEDEK